jgi:hypothetical protein
VYLADRNPVEVLPPAALGRTFESYQQVEGLFRGQTYYLEAWVKADEERLVMVAFNSFGTKMFELEQGSDGVRFSSALPMGAMKPEYILEDLQLCFFPAAPLKESLAKAGLSFDERQEGSVTVRTVSGDGRLVLEIRSSAGEVRYRNLLRGYQYTIRETEDNGDISQRAGDN